MPYTTDKYEGMLAETIAVPGHKGDIIHAYFAKPLGPGPFPGIVLIPHAPGWDEFYKETTRRFAHHGYLALCPDIWCRTGHGKIEDVLAKARASGGLPDDQVVGDATGAARYLKGLPVSNGKVGVMGTCSGGRHTFLTACRTKGVFDAAVECWGGNVVQAPEKLTSAQPVSPIDYTNDLSCPLLGLFGEEDQSPTPAQVALHEQELKKHNKQYAFHMYKGAGHGFFYYDRAMYRQEQAVDGWKKVWAFLASHLGGEA
ncbi:MAG: dienelactone hydrolase family protein [Chloroflexota bacterium]|nr:dienelactone hydrolase family protein [Chloroflexota bacterium]